MNLLRSILNRRSQGELVGVPSYCTASIPAISALMDAYASGDMKIADRPLLIEATANQVNQFGGYTGMLPKDFATMIYRLADERDLDRAQIVLGGDHLGPLTWKDLPEAEAMSHAGELVRDFCLAGFRKIHLDTSMRLASDDPNRPLPVKVIARRGAELFKTCLDCLNDAGVSRDQFPEFIIGSEVPVPGGVSGTIDTLEVTSPDDFLSTVQEYREAIAAIGCYDYFDLICAVVVQPGVEYSDHDIAVYDPMVASPLVEALSLTPNLMFEGHSTDYQPPEALAAMVRDGVGILKVGPMITFAYREALYSLAEMEKWLMPSHKQSNLLEICEEVMCAHPQYWQSHYHGTECEKRLARHFSYSDRIRYYWTQEPIKRAVNQLMANYENIILPPTLLAQYAPCALGVRTARELINYRVGEVVYRYEKATSSE